MNKPELCVGYRKMQKLVEMQKFEKKKKQCNAETTHQCTIENQKKYNSAVQKIIKCCTQ